MKMQNNDTKDEGLKGNEKIEEAISALQQEPSQELLAHALTMIRRRMKEEGQLILAVEPSVSEQLKIQAVKTADGKKWWSAFTSFEEELKVLHIKQGRNHDSCQNDNTSHCRCSCLLQMRLYTLHTLRLAHL